MDTPYLYSFYTRDRILRVSEEFDGESWQTYWGVLADVLADIPGVPLNTLKFLLGVPSVPLHRKTSTPGPLSDSLGGPCPSGDGERFLGTESSIYRPSPFFP